MKVKTFSLVRSALASTLLLGALLAAPAAASAVDVRNFTATISPTTSAAGATQGYTITLTNANNSKKIKSASFAVPTGWTLSGLAVSEVGWTAVQVGAQIQVKKAAGSDLEENESLTVTFSGTAPNVGGVNVWTAVAYESSNLSGTAHTITSAQPTVTVAPNPENDSTECSDSLDNDGDEDTDLADDDCASFRPTLTVIKTVVNNSGRNATAPDFTINVTGAVTESFPGSDTGTVVTFYATGTYAVSETATSSYAASYSTDCSGTMLIGETKTCTVTNDDIAAPTTGIIEVRKDVVAPNGGAADDTTPFTLTLTAEGYSSTTTFYEGLVAIFDNLLPGTYTVGEAAAVGYQLTGISPATTSAIIAGQTLEVTVTNRQISNFGELTVTKEVVGAPEGIDASDFPLFLNGLSITSGVATTTAAGERTITETSMENYSATWSEGCPDGVVNVPSEGSVTCTLTNTYTPPTTGVRVWKDVIARDRETDVEDDATFTVTLTFVGEGEYSTSSTFSENSPALFAPLEPGTYYVSEEGGDSYETFEIPETVTVVEGKVEEITIINRQLGSSGVVVIEKNVIDENGNDISDGTFFTVVIDGEEEGGLSASIAEGSPDTRELGLGSHSISENPQGGYELVSIEPSVIEPSLEGTTTIVVTNRRLAAPDEGDGSRHSASGRRRGRVLGASTDGAVLGSSTDSCEMYLTEYIWKNRPNNPAQVSKLQEFLNKVQNAGLTVNGEYDAATQEAVGVYQVANWAAVLAPWFGNAEPHLPTFNVYKTTRWLINETECAGSEAYPVL